MTTASQKTRTTRPIPPMSSRHFWFIADTLMEAMERSEGDNAAKAATAEIARMFARRLRQSNGQFRADQFLAACGVTD